MSRLMVGGLAAAALVAAFALGTRFAGVERVEVQRDPQRTTAPVVTVTAPSSDATLTADQVRAIVREELAGVRKPDEPDPQVVEARDEDVDRAHDLIARAIATGAWTEQDRDDLRAAVMDLERAQFDEVMSALIPAVNDGRLRLAFEGTPL